MDPEGYEVNDGDESEEEGTMIAAESSVNPGEASVL